MKKILFVTPSYHLGGTNTSLMNLVSNIDATQYELYIYAINDEGPLKSELLKYCKAIGQINGTDSTGKRSFKTQVMSIGKKVFKIIRFLGIDMSSSYYMRIANSFDRYHFDCIIAFQEGNATRLVSYCRNCKKVAWVRSEYTRYLRILNRKPEVELYGKFDTIVNVSNTAMKNFVSALPQYKNKTTFVYNLLNQERVLRMSNEPCEYSKDGLFTIISIGRVDPVKRFSEIPDIAAKMKNNGLRFRWLILGGKQLTHPEEFENIEEKIKNYGLQNDVLMMGNQPNPYNILKQGDLLVCLSESETFNHTFFEARLLNVPVLSVDYESASEMLKLNTGGRIVKREYVGHEIEDLMMKKSLYDNMKGEIKNFSYDNQAIINKIYSEVFEY